MPLDGASYRLTDSAGVLPAFTREQFSEQYFIIFGTDPLSTCSVNYLLLLSVGSEHHG